MSKFSIIIVGEKQVGAEMKKLFLQKNSSESTSNSSDICSGHQSATQSGNLIARAGDICRKLRNRRSYSILKPSHDLQLIESKDFDFVRCVNKHTKCIDGDVPFDACGITQMYKNGSIYVRLNTSILQLERHNNLVFTV